jgi:hypothetical protein
MGPSFMNMLGLSSSLRMALKHILENPSFCTIHKSSCQSRLRRADQAYLTYHWALSIILFYLKRTTFRRLDSVSVFRWSIFIWAQSIELVRISGHQHQHNIGCIFIYIYRAYANNLWEKHISKYFVENFGGKRPEQPYWVVRDTNGVMPENQSDCSGEEQQHFTRPIDLQEETSWKT